MKTMKTVNKFNRLIVLVLFFIGHAATQLITGSVPVAQLC